MKILALILFIILLILIGLILVKTFSIEPTVYPNPLPISQTKTETTPNEQTPTATATPITIPSLPNSSTTPVVTQPTSTLVWYFAYGSNLDEGTMHSRVQSWTDLQPATLKNFKRVFAAHGQNSSAFANIIADPQTQVEGAVYQITETSAQALDRYEGVPTQYVRIPITVKTASGQNLTVFAYQYSPGPVVAKAPASSYLNLIVGGLKKLGYSQVVIDEVIKAANP